LAHTSASLPPLPPEPVPVKIDEKAGHRPAWLVLIWYKHCTSSGLRVPPSSCTPAKDPAYPLPEAQVSGFEPPVPQRLISLV
jgi:hypothetical protein